MFVSLTGHGFERKVLKSTIPIITNRTKPIKRNILLNIGLIYSFNVSEVSETSKIARVSVWFHATTPRRNVVLLFTDFRCDVAPLREIYLLFKNQRRRVSVPFQVFVSPV